MFVNPAIHKTSWNCFNKLHPHQSRIADIKHKISQKVIYTNKILHAINTNSKTKNDKFNSDKCKACEKLGINAVENTEHIFSTCPKAIEINVQHWNDIKQKLHPFLKVEFKKTFYNLGTNTRDEDTDIGDRGLIPAKMMRWIKTHKKNKKSCKAEFLLLQLTDEFLLKKWGERCKRNFEKTPSGVKPPQEREALPSEESLGDLAPSPEEDSTLAPEPGVATPLVRPALNRTEPNIVLATPATAPHAHP
jgi:hypothetical protein